MISAPGVPGVVFGSLADGDGRVETDTRAAIAGELGISSDWATVRQIHGATVVPVDQPGDYGEADGLVTSTKSLPLVVATADCVPVGLIGRRTVAIVHAGWRGVAAGIVPLAAEAIAEADDSVRTVVIGPHIGPCCYEVGPDVIGAIGGHQGTTTWGTVSADLDAAIRQQIPNADVVSVGTCTMHDATYASHRRDGTALRQIAIAWVL
jgi:YfiH family protein